MKKIRINGPIVNDGEAWIYNWLDIPHVSPSAINKELDLLEAKGGGDLLVLINSGGGSVFAASEIYHALKSYGVKNTVKVEIPSIAASAASVLAMAATAGQLAIAPTGQVMIHNAATRAQGDYREMDDTSDFLKGVNKSIINAYTKRTGLSEEELEAMMNKETYMTAQEALENGFVDRILFEDDASDLFVASEKSVHGILPEAVVKEMQNKLASGEINLGGKIAAVSNSAEENPLNVIEDDSQRNEGKKKMDKEKLKNEHPELYEQIKNEGFEAGVQAENGRIKEIEDLSMPGNEDLINGAKYDEKIDAKDLAMKIIKAEKQKGSNFISNSKKDAEEVDQVGASDGTDGVDSNADDSKTKINNFVELYNGGGK